MIQQRFIYKFIREIHGISRPVEFGPYAYVDEAKSAFQRVYGYWPDEIISIEEYKTGYEKDDVIIGVSPDAPARGWTLSDHNNTIRERRGYGDVRVTPKQAIYYALVSDKLVLGPFSSEADANKRRNLIGDKSDWTIRPMWQG